jgi:signal transduction histidine kinase
MVNFAIQLAPTAALAAALGYLLLLVLTARMRGLPGATERWFAAYLILSALWTVAWALGTVWHWIHPWFIELGDSLTVAIAVLLSPMLAVLTLHFLPQRGARELTIAGVVWAVVMILLERDVIGIPQRLTLLNSIGIIGWVGFTLGSVVVTALTYARLHRPLHRNRVLYWLVALLLVVLGEGLHYFYSNETIAQIGVPLRLVGAMLMTYAMATYSLPDLKSVGRRSLLAIIVTLVSVILYVAAIGGGMLAYQLLQRTSFSSQQQIWFSVIAVGVSAFVLAIVQAPVQRIVGNAAERLLFGPGYDASRALRNYSQSISNILHIERLTTVAVETIAEALDVEKGGLLLITERDENWAEGRVISGMGDLPTMEVLFKPDSPVLNALRDTNRPLTQYDIDMLPEFRDMDPGERQWQWALDVEVYVPIHAKRTLIGALILGAKQTGEPYNAQDLDVLNTLAGQTAVALENARLFDDQRRLNVEISELNEELTDANLRLQKLDKAKSDFLNITSHELRTPLTQVRGYADILNEMVGQEEINGPYVIKVTKNIRRATDRLEAIYSAMIDVSAIGVDALQLHFEPVRPALFIMQAVENWRDALLERQQTIEIDGIQDLPAIEGDQERLIQSFSNLINNAIKFTPDGGDIRVEGRMLQDYGGMIEIVIVDQGIGIDPEDHNLIFEKFYRVGSADLHSTGTVKFKGAGPGLGLPIAKGVVEAHGGRIWVESLGQDEENCPGSRFHVLLPLEHERSDVAQTAAQLKQTRPMTGLARRLAPKDEKTEGSPG